ncbi:MAG: hypothetical protein AB7K71_13720 [Polyangiaceae bacterium]
MASFRDFLDLSPDELRKELSRGYPIDPESLDDFEYKGVSLGLPGIVEKLTWKKFMKTFHRDPETGVLRGWNVRIQQSPLADPSWEPMIKKGDIFSFGHYEVVSLDDYEVPGPALNGGLMIDYSLGQNKTLDFVNRVRDPIVAVEKGSSQLLLGWSYIQTGLRNIGTPSYFSLERHQPLTHRAAPPRSR